MVGSASEMSGATLRDETFASEAAPRAVPGLWVLFSTVSGVQGAALPLDAGETVVGRGLRLSGGRALSDPRISKRHIEVALRDESSARLRDLGSRNGSFVGGERVVGTRVVTQSEVIRVGGTFLEFLPDLREVMCAEPADRVSGEFLGTSPATRRIRERIRQLAGLEVAVMVLGPPGAGKEQVARALHAVRAGQGRMVSLNCSVLTNELAASALFGHVRGAFTGAKEARQGAFRRADGGTLFLDEVGDLPGEVQPKLLRALQEGRFQPLGSDRALQVDVRVVSATNQDVAAMVRARTFRGDLYSRLAGSLISVSPLAERPADIVVLAQHILGADRVFHPTTVDHLLNHSWPYNVRDLQSVIRLLEGQPTPVRLAGPAKDKLRADRRLSLPEPRSAKVEEGPVVRWPEGARERTEVLRQLLERCQGNVSRVARLLGKRHTSVRRWIGMYGIDLDRYRS